MSIVWAIFVIVILPVLLVLTTEVLNRNIKIRKPKIVKSITPKTKQSDFAEDVTALNNKLPANQRLDLSEVLAALDIQYGIDDLNSHSNPSYGCNCRVPRERMESWRDPRYAKYLGVNEHRGILQTMADFNNKAGKYNRNLPKTCTKYPEFDEFKVAIQDILNANAAQERALELAGVKSDLDRVSSILETLRNESKIINAATEDIKSL